MEVLLFSGGLDSFITAKLLDPDVLLYCDTKSRYSEKEIANLKRLNVPQDKIIIDTRLNLETSELENHIVPLRNLFFAMLGFSYGNEIMLASTKGDTTKDKDYYFATLTDSLMNHLITEEKDDKTFPWKAKGLEPRLILPVREWTKTELVEKYLKAGYSKEDLWQSISCYGKERECGDCKSCFRKSVAFINNDIWNPSLFTQEIDFPRFAKQTIDKNRAGEVEDTRKAMGILGIGV